MKIVLLCLWIAFACITAMTVLSVDETLTEISIIVIGYIFSKTISNIVVVLSDINSNSDNVDDIPEIDI